MNVLDNSDHAASSASPVAKARMTYACEACRAAKVKCQPSGSGMDSICRRCVASKKECVFKTSPRTRRRRSKLHPAATRSTPPPSAPSKTFTIDVPMPTEDGAGAEPSETMHVLHQCHENIISTLVPEDHLDSDGDAWPTRPPSLVSGGGATTTTSGRPFSTPTPSSGSRSAHHGIQPQFNLDSATALLALFREGMLPCFPVTDLPADASVPALARARPFVLLAILAVASGSKSLQGHNLYDEEFRRVLGLKFVSGGERSLELLVGLLIYCAWYPFHLRPKTRQALQYIRMASDIVKDLYLDQAVDDEYPLNMRYIQPAHERGPVQTLIWLVRLGHIVEETLSLTKRQLHEDQQVLLMVKGLEAQLREWQAQISIKLLSQTALRTANLFAEIVLLGYPLLDFPYRHSKKSLDLSSPGLHADPDRLLSCAAVLRVWYQHIATLPASEFLHFTGIEWCAFVIAVILGLRLSFPMPSECPGWDHATARRTLSLGSFLEAFSNAEEPVEDTPAAGGSNMDILSASKVVVGVVRLKYEKRLAALEEEEAAAAAAKKTAQLPMSPPVPPHPMLPGVDDSLRRCPMLDGSLDGYLKSWDDTFRTTASKPVVASEVDTWSGAWDGIGTASGAGPSGRQSVVFHDLWATMTMGWTRDGDGLGDVDFDGI